MTAGKLTFHPLGTSIPNSPASRTSAARREDRRKAFEGMQTDIKALAALQKSCYRDRRTGRTGDPASAGCSQIRARRRTPFSAAARTRTRRGSRVPGPGAGSRAESRSHGAGPVACAEHVRESAAALVGVAEGAAGSGIDAGRGRRAICRARRVVSRRRGVVEPGACQNQPCLDRIEHGGCSRATADSLGRERGAGAQRRARLAGHCGRRFAGQHDSARSAAPGLRRVHLRPPQRARGCDAGAPPAGGTDVRQITAFLGQKPPTPAAPSPAAPASSAEPKQDRAELLRLAASLQAQVDAERAQRPRARKAACHGSRPTARAAESAA